jgi:hypothetical protein
MWPKRFLCPMNFGMCLVGEVCCTVAECYIQSWGETDKFAGRGQIKPEIDRMLFPGKLLLS